jgi:choline dehydrogenase-like flavoprotein
MANQYDVIVIGSGVAGALCAWKLLELKPDRKILILEAGDNEVTHGQRIEFHHVMDQQGPRADMYAPYAELESKFYAPAPENAQKELKDQKADLAAGDRRAYYDYTDGTKDAFKAGYNRMVGGSTWSWRGNTPRFLPNDFKLRSNFGVGRDWPMNWNPGTARPSGSLAYPAIMPRLTDCSERFAARIFRCQAFR